MKLIKKNNILILTIKPAISIPLSRNCQEQSKKEECVCICMEWGRKSYPAKGNFFATLPKITWYNLPQADCPIPGKLQTELQLGLTSLNVEEPGHRKEITPPLCVRPENSVWQFFARPSRTKLRHYRIVTSTNDVLLLELARIRETGQSARAIANRHDWATGIRSWSTCECHRRGWYRLCIGTIIIGL